jgi:hypothetical protein
MCISEAVAARTYASTTYGRNIKCTGGKNEMEKVKCCGFREILQGRSVANET